MGNEDMAMFEDGGSGEGNVGRWDVAE